MGDKRRPDPIGKSLGLSPLPISSSVATIVADSFDNSANRDFEHARANLIRLIETIKNSIDELSMIAEQGQHPRSFEVLAKLTDSYVAANRELLELQARIREIEGADRSTTQPNPASVTNNLFVGSTAELQKMINQMKNND